MALDGPIVGALRERTVIIGNAGSGKSWLATELAGRFGIARVDLDRIHWDDENFSHKRDESAARDLVRAAASQPRWIIEGVYGWLAECAIPRATALIWLDLPWPDCAAGLKARGPWRGVTEDGFREFLAWAEAYATRQTSTSHAGHRRIFDAFAGPKLQLRSRAAVNGLLAELSA